MRRPSLHLAALLLLCLGLSCKENAKSEGPAPGPPTSFAGKPTAALIQRPDLSALVEDLAKEGTLESSHIGEAGAPSAVYAKFEAIRAKATEAELRALLEHSSGVVRGYTAQHVAIAVGAHIDALVPLADDTTLVPILSGCAGGHEDMGSLVREALCASELPEASRALLAIGAKGGRSAAMAYACAAPLAPGPTAEAAARALRGPLDKADEATYLRVLWTAPTPNPSDGCALARERAASDDASVKIGVAQALGRCNDAASQRVLLDLAGETNVVVAKHAKASLFLTVEARRAELAGNPEVMAVVGERLDPALRSLEGTKRDLGLVEELARRYPASLSSTFHRALVTPETTQAALRILAQAEPGKVQGTPNARPGIFAYLVRAKDPAATRELRRSLDAADTSEVLSALRAVMALKDKALRPEVEKLTTHPDPQIVMTAKRTLAAL
jgi:hypothetical protein